MKPRKQRLCNPERWLRWQWTPDIVQPSPKTILEMAREAREHHACLYYLPTLDTNGFTTSHALVFERLPPSHSTGDDSPQLIDSETSTSQEGTPTEAESWLRDGMGDGSVSTQQDKIESDDDDEDDHVFSMQITRTSDSDRGIVHLARLDMTSFHIPPSTLPHLTHLISLRLQGNRLTTVPEAIFRLPCLRELDLSHNHLSTLSGLIALLASTLQELFLQSNQLSSLPQQIGRLTRLKMLDIADNRLACVPIELKKLVSDSVVGGNRGNNNHHHHNQHSTVGSNITIPSGGGAGAPAAPSVALDRSPSCISSGDGRESRGLPLRRRMTESGSNSGSGGIHNAHNIGEGIVEQMAAFAGGQDGGGITEEDEGRGEEDAVQEEEEAEEGDEADDEVSEMDVLLDTADESGEGGHHDDDYVQIRPGIKCWTRGNRFWQVDQHQHHFDGNPAAGGSGLIGTGIVSTPQDILSNHDINSSSTRGRQAVTSPSSVHSRIPTAFDTLASSSQSFSSSLATGATSPRCGSGGLIDEAAHARKDSYTSSPWTPSLVDLCSQMVGERLYRDPHFYCTVETCPEKWQRQQQRRRRQRAQNINRGAPSRKHGVLSVHEDTILEEGEGGEGEKDQTESSDSEDEGVIQRQNYQRWLAKGKMKAAGDDDGKGPSPSSAEGVHQTLENHAANQHPVSMTVDLPSDMREALQRDASFACLNQSSHRGKLQTEDEDEDQDVAPVDYKHCVIRILPEWTFERLGLFRIAELRRTLVAHDRKLRWQRRQGKPDIDEQSSSSSDLSDDDDHDDGLVQRGQQRVTFTHGLSSVPEEATTPQHRPAFHQQWAPIALTVEEQEQEKDRCSVCGQRLFFEGMVWKRVGVLGERVVPLELVACSVPCRARAEQEERLRRREAHMRHRRQRGGSTSQYATGGSSVGSGGGAMAAGQFPRRARSSTHTTIGSAASSVSVAGSSIGGSISRSSSIQADYDGDPTTSPIAPAPMLNSPTPIPLAMLQGFSLPSVGEQGDAGGGDFVVSPTTFNMPSAAASGSSHTGGGGLDRRESTISSSYSQGVEQPRSSSPWPSQDLLQSQTLSQADSSHATPTAVASLAAASSSCDLYPRDSHEAWSSSSVAAGGGGGAARGREHFTVSPVPKISSSSGSTPTPFSDRHPPSAGAGTDTGSIYSGQHQQPQQPPVSLDDDSTEQVQPSESSIFSRFPPPLPPLVVPTSSYVVPRLHGDIHHSRLFRNECSLLCLVRQNPRTRSYSI